MDEQDLLALRFPSRVPVKFHVIEPDGSRISGGPWTAQALDVSRTGVRLEASDLSAVLLKKLGDDEANLRLEISFEQNELPVVGVIRWLRDFGAGRWIIGVEYVPADRSRGIAIASHFERRYLRPKAVRLAAAFGALFVVFAAVLVYGAYERQKRVVARAEAELAAAIEQKESLAIVISELEAMMRTQPGKGDPTEIAKEIASLRAEMEHVRYDVGKKSIALADASQPAGSSSRPLLDRGNRFFSEGNMAGARAEYEKIVQTDPTLAEPYLKLGIVYEFQERPADAFEAYRRYLERRTNAPDRVEVEGRMDRIAREIAPASTVVAIAQTPTPALPTPVKTPSAEDAMMARARALLQEGHALLKAEKPDEAVRAYRTVVKDFGGFADGHYWLATGLAFQGEDGAACKEFTRYLEIAPNGSLAATARANVAECD